MDSSVEIDLHDTQKFLAAQYSKLRAERDGKPVFAIEHGLNEAQTNDLLKVTGRCFARFGVDSEVIRQNPLPIVAASTEIGYRYRGTGTEFWPALETALNAEILIADREKITGLFIAASNIYGLAKPNESAWSRSYRHIAWPVRNAVAPMEIHLALAATLRTVLRSFNSSTESIALLPNLRAIAAGLWSRRLEDWLTDEDTATDLTNFLLSGEETRTWLTKDIIRRISSDLRSDPDANRALQDAADAGARRGARKIAIPPRSRFAISVKNGSPQQLLLKGPELSTQARNNMVNLFETYRNFVSCGDRNAVRLQDFLSGGFLDLGRPSEFPDSNVLKMMSDEKRTTDLTRRILEALQPEPPLLFAMSSMEGIAVNIEAGSALDSSKRHYELFKNEDGATEQEVSAGWPGFQIRRAHLEESGWREELADLGCIISKPEIVNISGGVSLTRSADEITCLAGLPLLIQTIGGRVELAMQDEQFNQINQTSLDPGKLAIVDLKEGKYSLRVKQESILRDISIRVEESGNAPAFSIDLNMQCPDMRNFLDAELTLQVSSPLPFDNLSLRGVISRGSETLAIDTIELSDLPARVSGTSKFFQNLRQAVLNSEWNGSSPLRLHVSVKGLGWREWLLASSPSQFLFQADSRTWRVEGSNEPIRSRICTALAPLIQDDQPKDIKAGFHLLLPASPERSALMSGRCFGAPTLVPGDEPISKPGPLLRELDSLGDSVGVLAVAEAYLAWRLSSVADVLSDYTRQKGVRTLESTLVQQLCGEAWCATETGSLFSTPIEALLHVCKEHELSRYGELPDVGPKYDVVLDECLRKEFSNAFPGFEAALAMDSELLAETLDYAVINAYDALNAQMISDGVSEVEDVDIGYPAQRWVAAIKEALNRWDLSIFQKLILPEARWDSLRAIDYSSTSENDLTEVVFASHIDADLRSGITWLSRRELRTGLQLWLSPRQLLESEDWSADLTKLLSDQQSARALRYAALRSRAAMSAPARFSVPL